MHRTYRWLDAPPRLLGFSFAQWLTLVLALGGGYAATRLLHVPFKLAASLGVFAIGLPAALAYLSEGDGMPVARIMLDALAWSRARVLERVREPARAADLLGVLDISADGVLVRTDGVYVRYLEVEPINPLVRSEQACEQVADALGGVLARLQAGQSVQLYVDARPLSVQELVAREQQTVDRAAHSVEEAGDVQAGDAMRRLGDAFGQSLLTHCEAVAAMSVRYLIVVPWRPVKLPRRRDGIVRLDEAEHERVLRDSQRHAEGIRRDLEAMRLTVRTLDRKGVREVLCARVPDSGDGDQDAGLDFSPRDHVRAGETVERVSYLAGVPEHTWLGWLMHLMQAPLPYSLSVHVTATDRLRERQAQRRRWKRLRGVNIGTELRGRPVDPAAVEQEQEAAELARDLAVSAGAAIYRLAAYVRMAEPASDPQALGEQLQAAAREALLVADARIEHGIPDAWSQPL